MTDFFGDDEPEEGWDADDPPRIQLDNLARRLVAILAVEQLADRLHQRLEMIRDDLAHVRDKVGK